MRKFRFRTLFALVAILTMIGTACASEESSTPGRYRHRHGLDERITGR